ncbi:MAG: type I methionyl aminopeptidase [Patescibacteria group bacterium]
MSLIKTPEEIAILKQGGEILSKTLQKVMCLCVAGSKTDELDRAACEEFKKRGAFPSFLGYQISPSDPPFPSALCVSINDEVVHGPAYPSRTIKDGDIVSLDIGCWYQGLATDMATTVLVGEVSEEARNLARATRESLVKSLAVVKEGALVSDIGVAIEDHLKPKGYGIVRELVGHGVGHSIHEEPQIPHFRDPRTPKMKLVSGMVIAIEPMVTLGHWKVDVEDDGWTIKTHDKSLAAHFEVTIAVTKNGYELITPWPDKDKKI